MLDNLFLEAYRLVKGWDFMQCLIRYELLTTGNLKGFHDGGLYKGSAVFFV